MEGDGEVNEEPEIYLQKKSNPKESDGKERDRELVTTVMVR